MEARRPAIADLPTGTVTFLFTDIESSTSMWERNAEAMQRALARHDEILQSAIEAHNGHVFKTVGDAFCAAFASAPDALEAALSAQRALYAEEWNEGYTIRARMALHTGTVEESGGDYFGPPVNRVARLLSAGHGGQTLLSLATQELVRDQLPSGTGLRDLGERRLKDLIRPERIFQLAAPELPSDLPPLKTLDERSHNLPAPRTSFVGREREIVEVKRALAMTRLLTLTGVGGSGKTRLALEVGRDVVGVYPDGVWLAELAPLSEGDLVAQAVAGALGVQEQPGRPLIDALVETLGTKELLLVLDNCEHLADSVAPLLDTLLDTCQRLRVLATSREALDVAGELRWLVPAFSVPDPRRPLSAKELERYESVRLFTERARYRNPSFVLTQENTRAVAEICRRLDGVPLAIELAAARVGSLSVEQIAKKLEGSLDLLSGGRTASERHRTLRGALDWSYRLLSEQEQALFCRLSVFTGGWTLEAAEAVGAGEGVEREDVTDFLSGLVEKSLVVVEAGWEGEMRYSMLEPVRQYGYARLEERRQAKTILRRYVEYFLALTEAAEPAVQGAEQDTWIERLETEHDNIRAALSWSLQQRADADSGLRMGAALGEFWYLRGYVGEGRRKLDEALAKPGWSSVAARGGALTRVSWLAYLQGDLDRAVEASEEGLRLDGIELLRTGSGDNLAAELMRTLGIAVSGQSIFGSIPDRGDSDRAIELYEKSLAIDRKAGNARGAAVSLLCLGDELKGRGDFERAMEIYEEGMRQCRAAGDPTLLASILAHVGYTFMLQGDLERATAVSEEAAAMLREQEHRFYLAEVLYNLGWIALLQSNHKRAKSQYEESLQLCLEVGDKVAVPGCLEALACAAAARGEAERVATLFGSAQALREVTGYREASAEEELREPYLGVARSRLNEASWKAAFAEGQAMELDEAVDYALSEELPAFSTFPAPEQPSAGGRLLSLTRREEKIATLIARGLTNRQIASELTISEHTVESHVAKILKKLGFDSRSQIIAWMVEQRTPP